MAGWPEREIARIAAGQRALVTRFQLISLGLSRAAVDHAAARGRLHRVHHGLYSMMPLSVLPPLACEVAATLACGDNILVSHHTAAGVWGIRPTSATRSQDEEALLAALRRANIRTPEVNQRVGN